VYTFHSFLQSSWTYVLNVLFSSLTIQLFIVILSLRQQHVPPSPRGVATNTRKLTSMGRLQIFIFIFPGFDRRHTPALQMLFCEPKERSIRHKVRSRLAACRITGSSNGITACLCSLQGRHFKITETACC
jgi:hypothetical protein